MQYFLRQNEYDRKKSRLETERAKANNERKLQYYKEVKDKYNNTVKRKR